MAGDFLLEIGTEELPSSACEAVLDLLPARVAGLFAAAQIELGPDALDVMVGPRRIALLVRDLPENQTPRETAQRGPSVEAAFDADGRPTQAALGFARAKGLRPEDLQVREENGRSFVHAVVRGESRPTAELLPDICQKIVRDMYFPKNMRWGARDLRFSRPMRWLVALFGSEVVPFEVAGVRSGRESRGHRWLGAAAEIPAPGGYVEALRSQHVLVDQREREASLWDALRRLAAERSLDVIDPMEKMREVRFLVEWPTVLTGSFAEEHLRLPDEVLVTAMQSHQRYFPLIDAEGRLASTFLFAMNGDPAFADQIRNGNERVLEGRIEDAEFSFDKDLATGLDQMAAGLDRVVFHVKVGTMRDKTERLVALTGSLADLQGVGEGTRDYATQAARLAKADQVSVMVREFADLEGVMGETYARMEGLHEEVAQAIREQYLPDAAGGVLPRTLPGALLATAEKVDNITAAFACAEPPSGSKDPYGLRRAAMGMVTIAFAHGFTYDVGALVEAAYQQLARFPGLVPRESVVSEASDFILERLVKFLTDMGVSREAVEAVLPTSRAFGDLRKRAVSLESFRATESWDDLVVVYSRPANLAKKLGPEDVGPPSATLFEADAERSLFEAWETVDARAAELGDAEDYLASLQVLAGLRPAVDRYFDDVLVMVERDEVRTNRLRQLAAVRDTVRRLVHLERIPG